MIGIAARQHPASFLSPWLGVSTTVLLSVLACHPSAPRLASEPCLGARALTVRNETLTKVDVYMHLGINRSPQYIGIANVGSTELSLPLIDPRDHPSFTAHFPVGTLLTQARLVPERAMRFELICHAN
jgi:hypothetical protein